MTSRKGRIKPNRTDFLLTYSQLGDQPFEWEHLSKNSTQSLLQMCLHLRIPIPCQSPTKGALIESLKKSPKFDKFSGSPSPFPGEARLKDSTYLINSTPLEKKKKTQKIDKEELIIGETEIPSPYNGSTYVQNKLQEAKGVSSVQQKELLRNPPSYPAGIHITPKPKRKAKKYTYYKGFLNFIELWGLWLIVGTLIIISIKLLLIN